MRIYEDRVKIQYPTDFGRISKGPQNLIIKKNNKPAKFMNQPIPLHDYINFKTMPGNEIILNLDNVENLRNSELISGLLELGKRDKLQEHDWNIHPVTQKCL